MPRQITSNLADLLSRRSLETHTMLSVVPADDEVPIQPITVGTTAFTDVDPPYTPDLISVDEIRQTLNSEPNRVVARIQNVDGQFISRLTEPVLVRATTTVWRLFIWPDEPDRPADYIFLPLFRGECRRVELNEEEIVLEIVTDLVAAGLCVASWSLADHCQFVFKDAGTCGYSGSETVCNKQRRSLSGCEGRANEHRFGGMEFPDVQLPAPPPGPTLPPVIIGGGGGGGGGNRDGGGQPFPEIEL